MKAQHKKNTIAKKATNFFMNIIYEILTMFDDYPTSTM